MHRSDAEAQRVNEITDGIIGASIEVHRALGPGLLESAYEECLCFELVAQGLAIERQAPLPVEYKGIKLDCGYRMDIVVNDLVVVEIKAVDRMLPVHEAQLLTYLRLRRSPVGLLINFNVPVLRQGLKRIVHNLREDRPQQSSTVVG
jgi:GxxExxY protein